MWIEKNKILLSMIAKMKDTSKNATTKSHWHRILFDLIGSNAQIISEFYKIFLDKISWEKNKLKLQIQLGN